MKSLILSGVGGSSNWLPLFYPLIAIIIIAYCATLLVKYIKKRKLHRGHELISDELDGHFEDVTEHN